MVAEPPRRNSTMNSVITLLSAAVLALLVVGLVFPYGFPLATPLVAATFFLTIVHCLATNRALFYDGELVLVYAGALGFALLGVALSPRLYASVRGDIVNAFAGILMIPVFCRVAATGKIAQFRTAFAVLSFLLLVPVALLCLYKFHLYLQGTRLPWLIEVGPDGRYPVGSALQTDYNMAALGLTVGAASGIWLITRVRSVWLHWLIIAAISATLLAALLTGSRRFFVVFGVAILVAAIYSMWRFTRSGLRLIESWRVSRHAGAHALAIILIAGVGLYLLRPWLANNILVQPSGQFTRLETRLTTLFELLDTLQTSRGALLSQSIQLVDSFTFANFLFGHGFDYLESLSLDGEERYPHNSLLAALLYGGLPNLLLVAYMLVRAGFIYLEKRRTEPLLAVVFFITFAFAFISGNTVFSNQFFLTLLTLAFVLRYTSSCQRR